VVFAILSKNRDIPKSFDFEISLSLMAMLLFLIHAKLHPFLPGMSSSLI
jgi:hypothetical protein